MYVFSSVVDAHAPIREKRVSYKHRPDWWTDEISNAISQRNKVDKKTNFDNFKYWRNRVKSLIFQAKCVYYQSILEKGQCAIRDFWNHLRELVPGKKSSMPLNMSINGNELNDPSSIANGLNDWFSSVVDKYVTKSNEESNSFLDKLRDFVSRKKDSQSFFCIPEITIEFVEKQLKSLNTKKAAGLDGLQAKFLTISADVIAPSITGILNGFIQSGTFPTLWKRAKVTPLHKGGSISDPGNYRPVSILPILSKVLERHIHNHLIIYLQDNNLLHGKQSGFRAFHSCQSALTSLLDSWCCNIDKKQIIGVIFLDLRKAFDLVNHTILIEKLRIYGVGDNAFNFFQSYLTNREQCVVMNGYKSDSVPLSVGVPQGSILGPLLFLLYINDMPLHTSNCEVEMFADDKYNAHIG